MDALVGYTGFVGSNIYASGKFDAVYNSKNIKEAYGAKPHLLIYAGIRAEKYLANNAPEEDRKQIIQAEENIVKIDPKKLVLISTIDVFKKPKDVDENTLIDTNGLNAYGYNRYRLECWVRERYPDALIIRLPALFGKNLKKNFIYDFIHLIPTALKISKFEELSAKNPELEKYYELQDNGFYKANVLAGDDNKIKEIFRELEFTALNFTDSRSVYQFYNLGRLWDDMQVALNAGISLLHLATEPVSAGELYQYLTGEAFVNELESAPAYYDYKTIHERLFHGSDGYISNKPQVLAEIRRFVEECGRSLEK